jgi:hypothetical protein
MQAAERIVAGADLEAALWRELSTLQTRHPGGFMVRLHVLGDFYSLAYVQMWERALNTFPALHVFGFTAREPGTPMGDRLMYLATMHWDRFSVRFSGLAERDLGSVLEGNPGFEQAVQCPAQTEATDCCATCGLCWHSQRSIGFARH